MPQAPQFAGSLSVSVHLPPGPHWTGHALTSRQKPLVHAKAVGQTTPQTPQLLGSVVVSVQPDSQFV